jgi:predicted membrane protein
LLLLGTIQLFQKRLAVLSRKRIYFVSSLLILLGVAAMRWNVVIGGQLFSKSLRGFTTYKMEIAGHEGWVMALMLVALPFIILTVFIKLFLPPKPPGEEGNGAADTGLLADPLARGTRPEHTGASI